MYWYGMDLSTFFNCWLVKRQQVDIGFLLLKCDS